MSRRGWALFLALSVLWGIPYLMIRVAVREIDPVVVAWGRCVVGLLLLAPFAFRPAAVRLVLGRWRPLVIYSFVEIVIAWWLIGVAETRLTSATTALLIAAVPLFAALLATRFGHARLDGRRVVGLVVGFAGVAVTAGLDVHFGDLSAVLALVVVALCYAVGALMIGTQLRGLPPLTVIAGSLAIAAVAFLPFVAVRWPDQMPSRAAVVSVVALGVLCTALAFVLLFALIAEAGPTRAPVITYVNPAVAIIAGVLFLAEPFTLGLGIGFPLIVLGAILATGSGRTPGAQPRRERRKTGTERELSSGT